MSTATRVRPHQRADRDPCTLDGCDRKLYARSFCVMHYGRLRKHGDAGDPDPLFRPRGAGHVNADGYLIVVDHDHPLAGAQGKLRANRAVLYAKLGPGSHPCHWCAAVLPWVGEHHRMIHADHLDGDRLNNQPENLVAACLDCNTKRVVR